jgi:hypothetical protein
MKQDIAGMPEADPYDPIAPARLLVIYAIIWLGCGGVALLAHLITAPRYIDTPTRVVGGIANLLGPWARPVADGWPNAGKPPHAPSAFVGFVVLVLAAGVILASLKADSRWGQYFLIAAFVPLAALWIGIGFLELMVCAS